MFPYQTSTELCAICQALNYSNPECPNCLINKSIQQTQQQNHSQFQFNHQLQNEQLDYSITIINHFQSEQSFINQPLRNPEVAQSSVNDQALNIFNDNFTSPSNVEEEIED